jgi:hypothetical protein
MQTIQCTDRATDRIEQRPKGGSNQIYTGQAKKGSESRHLSWVLDGECEFPRQNQGKGEIRSGK